MVDHNLGCFCRFLQFKRNIEEAHKKKRLIHLLMENGYVRIFKKRKFCTEFSMEIPFAGRKKARTLPKPSMNYILRPAVYLGFYLKFFGTKTSYLGH